MKKNRLALAVFFVLAIGISNSQTTWEQIDKLPEGNIGVIAVSPNNQIFVNYHIESEWRIFNDNLYRSNNNGDSWEQIPFPEDCSINDICFGTQNDIYVGVGIWDENDSKGNDGIMYSDNNGEEWSHLFKDEPDCGHIDKICLNNTGNLLVIIDLGHLYQLSENDEDWIDILNCVYEEGCGTSLNTKNQQLMARELVVTEDNRYYLSTDPFFAISDNNGADWELSNIRASFNSISIYNNNDVVVGTDSSGIYHYNSANDIWTNIGLSGIKIKEIISQNNETLYVASQDSGFYFTNNNGDSWFRLNEGLDTLGLLSMAIDNEGYLYLGTSGKGVYKSLNTTVNIPNFSSTALCKLEQNYPNPFDNHTTFRFTLQQPTHVKLSIYNVLGELKEIVLDEYMTNGNHSVNWDATNIKSGLYFYRIESVDFSLTKTLLVH